MTPLDVYMCLDEEKQLSLHRGIGALLTLEQVLSWSAQRPKPYMILEVIVQDEYCHDVVMQWRDGNTLVFDTT